MDFDKVIAGILKYLNKNIFPGLNDWQTLLARTVTARVVKNVGQLKERILSNDFLRTFSVIDDNGRVDVDGLMEDLKQQIRNCPNGKVTIAIPMFGKYIFAESDIDELHRLIKEG